MTYIFKVYQHQSSLLQKGLCGFHQKSIFFLLGTSVAFLSRYDGPRYVIFLSGILIGPCWWKKKKIHKEHAVQSNICYWCGRNRKLHKQFGNYRFITTGVKSYRPFLTLNYPLVLCCAWAKYLVSLHASLTSTHQDPTLKKSQPRVTVARFLVNTFESNNICLHVTHN